MRQERRQAGRFVMAAEAETAYYERALEALPFWRFRRRARLARRAQRAREWEATVREIAEARAPRKRS